MEFNKSCVLALQSASKCHLSSPILLLKTILLEVLYGTIFPFTFQVKKHFPEHMRGASPSLF